MVVLTLGGVSSLCLPLAVCDLAELKASTMTEMNSELITHTLKNTKEYRYSYEER